MARCDWLVSGYDRHLTRMTHRWRKTGIEKMDALYARLGGAFPFGFQIEGKKCVTFCT
jgi:hypothetical protein